MKVLNDKSNENSVCGESGLAPKKNKKVTKKPPARMASWLELNSLRN